MGAGAVYSLPCALLAVSQEEPSQVAELVDGSVSLLQPEAAALLLLLC